MKYALIIAFCLLVAGGCKKKSTAPRVERLLQIRTSQNIPESDTTFKLVWSDTFVNIMTGDALRRQYTALPVPSPWTKEMNVTIWQGDTTINRGIGRPVIYNENKQFHDINITIK